eukprot:scaffold4819_cov66-Cylindrotheca_fusiformis.AAC.2
MKSPVLPRHTDDDHDDDDSLSEDDNDNNNNNMTRLNSMTRLVSESWRAVESAALAIPSADEQQKLSNTNGSSGRLGGSIRSPGGNNSSSMRSSVGRLGGSIRGGSIRSSLRSSPTKSERTSLLQREDDMPPPPPALLKWIWIALACAICYALYNISIKKGSASINPILGGVILQFVAALLGSLLLGIMMCRGNAIYYDKK